MLKYLITLPLLVAMIGCASTGTKISGISLNTSLERDKHFLNNLHLSVEQGLDLESAVACDLEDPESYLCFGEGAVIISVANWKQGIADEVQFLVNGNPTSHKHVMRAGLERAFVFFEPRQGQYDDVLIVITHPETKSIFYQLIEIFYEIPL